MKPFLGWLLLVSWAAQSVLLVGEEQPYSKSPGYAAILAELGRKVIRPSSLSAGGLLRGELPPVSVEANETPAGLRLETTLWRVEMQKKPWTLAVLNKRTGASWRLSSEQNGVCWRQDASKDAATLRLESVERVQKQGNRWVMQGNVGGSGEPVVVELGVISPNILRLSVDGEKLGETARLGFTFGGAGPFFGLGEKFVKAKLDGLQTTLISTDRLFTPGHNWTYIPVPYVLTPQGMGVYLDTAWKSNFDFREADRQRFSAELEGPSTDCYFFVNDGPKGVVESYTSLMGRIELPPPWTFGVWVTSLQGKNATLDDARRLRAQRIPASALWTYDQTDAATNLGWPYWTAGYYGPLRQYTDELHKLGLKVLTYTNNFVWGLLVPYTNPNPTFEEGIRNGYFALQAGGTVRKILDGIEVGNIDITNPAAVDWWAKMLHRVVLDYGFDGWMEDFGEGGWIGEGFQFAAGKTMREMSNLYPLIYHKVAHDITQPLKADLVRFARSGYSGSQGYSINWGGDQVENWTLDQGLPSVIPAGISAGLAGYSVWAPDIVSCGFSKELWIRWTELGALMPIMRDHLAMKPKFAVDLWFDAETTDIFRQYARLHNSLFPYLYTYAHEAAKTGLPIIRHLMLEWPEDNNVYDADHEYLLGRQILVAPVVKEGARSRSFYLPKGFWVDYWTGQTLEGGRQVEVPAPLERIPILVRSGSVIPLADPEIETLANDLAAGKYRTLDNKLIWRIFPSGAASQSTFTSYDGTKATADQGAARVQLKVENSPVIRPYEVVLPPHGAAQEVTLSGRSLKQVQCAEIEAGKAGWCVNPSDMTLRAGFVSDNFTLSVTPH